MPISIPAAAGRLLAFMHDMPRYLSGELQHLPDGAMYANMGLDSPEHVDAALHHLHENGQIAVTKTVKATTADTDAVEEDDEAEPAPHRLETTDTIRLLDLRPVPRLTTETNEGGVIARPQTDPTDLHPNVPVLRHDLGTPEQEAAKPVLRAADVEGDEAEPGQGQDGIDTARIEVPEDVEPAATPAAVDTTPGHVTPTVLPIEHDEGAHHDEPPVAD